MKLRSLFLVAALAAAVSAAFADDWPSFRGPRRDGVSKETGLLKEWPKGGPKLVWTFDNAGLGHSSSAIVKGVLYTNGTRDGDEITLALDAATGKEIWKAKIGPIFTFKSNIWGDGPRSVPTVDGDKLYVLGAQGDFLCLDTAGKELWRKNLIKDFGGEMMTEWGYSESPLVVGNLVIVTPGSQTQGTVVAFDKTSGKVVWQAKELKYKAPYTSAVYAEIHGVPQVIQAGFSADPEGGYLSGIALKDGKLLWSEQMVKGHNYSIASTPIVRGNQVYVSAGTGAGCHLFDIDKDFKVKDLYGVKSKKSVKNNHGGLVLIGDHIYGHSEGSVWVCQEWQTGKLAWEERNDFKTKSGATTGADGMLYLLSEGGEVALVEANPAAWKLVSQFELPKRSAFPKQMPSAKFSSPWAHPVISGGKLFLRDHEYIFCFDVKK
ncbi:MAG: PQQ-like beta-propeller repeat protein [Gemmataceae bacterium]|nr:PQQ-like beta-propeller repeat protein [Gemmataceae bacterium]